MSSSTPIAIIGYACRLPGDVATPEDLWELCSRGRSGWSAIPPTRFSKDAYHHPNPSKRGCMNNEGGYFLQEDPALFDAPFFNLTVQEATALDPQQRLLLECTFEALESSGTSKEAVIGTNVGVFVGGSFADYEVLNTRDLDTAPTYQATGCAPAMQSNRLSYYFDLRGPSVTFDTACSSSLVALHGAMQSLRNGECPSAVVAGCHLNLTPDFFVTMSTSQLLNDQGKTFAFDHRAISGFARGEGAGAIILKPLDAALRDGDVVRAVIHNSGVNQDGRTQGITAPSGRAQSQLIRQVYANAGLDPADCGFAEMHGTGTKVGDPIEAAGIHEALGVTHSNKSPLYVGSVKTNVGHLEGTSGIVSIIKAAMMLEKRMMLPNANYEATNPDIPLSEWNMKVLKSTRPWPRGKKYVSVSNYGFGGTNAHVVLGAAPPSTKANILTATTFATGPQDPQCKLFVLSAHDQASLEKKIVDLGFYLEQRPEVFEKLLAGNLAYTLGQRRSHLPCRLAITAASSNALGVGLSTAKVVYNRARGEPTMGFVFTGQGAQWATMGAELIRDYPIYAAVIDTIDECLKSFGARFSLKDELLKPAEESSINLAHISQPACTAVQIALTRLLDSWGIHPSAVVGHSSGEIGCAFAAGILSLEDAMKVAYYRGQCMLSLEKLASGPKGTMLAVGAGVDEITPYCQAVSSGYVTVACINSPCSVTLSGDVDTINELQVILTEKSIFNRQLKVGVAYHSAHLNPVADEYLDLIKDIKYCDSATATFHSSLLGRIAEPCELTPSYWVRNLTSPVRFSESLATMASAATKINTMVELGPHSALQGPIRDILATIDGAKSKIQYVPTLLRGKDATECTLRLASTLYMKGAQLNFEEINFPSTQAINQTLLTDLPRYPWNHETRYWHESRISDKHCFKTGVRNDILGVLADYSNDLEPTWRNIVRLDDLPWLRQHKMQSMSVFPMAGYIAMAVEAAAQRATTRGVQFDRFDLREVVARSALVLNEETEIEMTITLRPYNEGLRSSSDLWDDFMICSWDSKRGWIQHCHGLVGVRSTPTENGVDGHRIHSVARDVANRKAAIIRGATSTVDIKAMYDTLAEIGAGYGQSFTGLNPCHGSDQEAYGELIIPDTKSLMPKGHETSLVIHPAFLDQVIQIMWPIFGAGRQGLDTLFMPTFIKNFSLSRHISTTPSNPLTVFGTGRPDAKTRSATKFDIFVVQAAESSEPLVRFDGLVMTPLRESDNSSGPSVRELCYKMEWQPVSSGQAVEKPAKALRTDVDTPRVNGEHRGVVRKDSAFIDARAEPDVTSPFSTGEVVAVVLGDDTESAIGDTFADMTTKITGIKPEIQTLDIFDSTFEGKTVVFVATQKNVLNDMTEQKFGNLRHMLLSASKTVWVYNASQNEADIESSMAVGFARTIRSETSSNIITVGLAARTGDNGKALIDKVFDVMRHTRDGSSAYKDDKEFVEKDHQLMVPRIVEDEDLNLQVHRGLKDSAVYEQPFHQNGRPLKLAIGTLGSLDSLYFVDDDATSLGRDEIQIEVAATGMNFKDIVVSMGQLAQPYIGVECAGIVNSVGQDVRDIKVGDRVMAMTEGAYSTYARCLSTSAAAIPDGIDFVSASTLPVVFCTAYYGLLDLGRLSAGESVLIHAAAGGVGQAAIMLAQTCGAEIFATVGSAEKKQLIMSTYGIAEDHIFYSRNTSFGPAIRQFTKGRGVDVVLNSLGGDFLRETWECLAPFGRFIEIGKADITKNSRLEMEKFEHNVTFSSVDLTKVAAQRPKLMKRLLEDVSKLLSNGSIKPVGPITSYGMDKIETAFRCLQSGKSMGKLVIAPQPGDTVRAASPKKTAALFKEDASYIIIGGTGGLGRSIAEWMATRGAKFVYLVSRSGVVSPKLQELIFKLAQKGTKISVRACDVSDRSSVDRLIDEVQREAPPIRGIVQGAMVLKDVLYEQMSLADFESVVKSKVAGTQNLHSALASSELDFFIALSSVAGIVGNRGQAAYAAANVFLDEFMAYRNSRGLAGTSLDLTAVSDVGYLADNSDRAADVLRNLGGETLDEGDIIGLLSAAVCGQTSQCDHHVITGLKIRPGVAEPYWVHDAKFSRLREAAASQTTNEGGMAISLPQALRAAPSAEAALESVYSAMVEKLATVLMLSLEEMEPSAAVSSYNLDSLAAIEVRNWIAREADANVQVLELLTSPSLMELAKVIVTKSKLTSFDKP